MSPQASWSLADEIGAEGADPTGHEPTFPVRRDVVDLAVDEPSVDVEALEAAFAAPGRQHRANPSGPAPLASGRGLSFSAAIGALFAALGAFIGARALYDNSFLTHLTTGHLIFDQGSVPTVDPYTFTAAGQPWVVQSWLASVVYASLDRALGAEAIVVFTGAATALLAAGIWWLGRAAPALPRIAMTAGALLVGHSMWNSRPLLFGLLALVAVMLAGDRRLPAWTMLPVFGLWVNLHGTFAYGLAVLALLAIGALADRRPADQERNALLFALGGSTIGALLSPVGVRLLTFPLVAITDQDRFAVIAEWQAPRFTGWGQRGFLLVLALALVAVARGRQGAARPASGPAIGWRALLPIVVFTLLALTSARNLSVATVVLTPLIAPGLVGLGTIEGRERRVLFAPLALAGAALTVVALVAAWQRPPFDLDLYPQAEVEWLIEAGHLPADDQLGQAGAVLPADRWSRIAAPDVVGNYLTHRFQGQVPIFVDDRVDMLPVGLVEDSTLLLRGEPDWADVLDRHEIEVVVWSAKRPLASLLELSPTWDVVQRSDEWIVAVRAG